VPAKPTFAPPPGFSAPGALTAPARVVGGAKPLVLPRRASPLVRAQEANAASVEARKSIEAIFSQSRPPWAGAAALSGSQVEELQKAVRVLEAKVAERDHAVMEAQARLAERERELAEAEALLAARERVVAAATRQASAVAPESPASREEVEALQTLRAELDRQEGSLKEQRQAVKEREDFLDQSESLLFSKMQQQQEKETELEQKEADLRRMMKQLGLLKDEPPPEIEKA
jgi:chromosome segregation ATPase